ncbi:MAG TPA: acetolactate synthase large subunit [Acidimicrobiales bacterium]|nr:acetolactate synthase large subunit [Acidimicrobiales bacterium]
MNGARVLMETLVRCGVDTCFTNPGTSEMQFVAALDDVRGMRAVLGLFEGVVTGAADGYGRMKDHPAATLLHLGPGLGNGIANLHNARRARTPIVNVIGDHATYHQQYDAPLQSDIRSLASPVSTWVGTVDAAGEVGSRTLDAYEAAMGPPSGVATLVVPADMTWTEAGSPAGARPAAAPGKMNADAVALAAKALRSGEPAALFIGGRATRRDGLVVASRVAEGAGAKLLCETFPSRLERGAGIPAVERLAYLAELAALQLDGLRHLVLVDAKSPVSFFAYPGKASNLVPEGCEVIVLAGAGDDVVGALDALDGELGGGTPGGGGSGMSRPELPSGPLTAQTAALVIGALLPEGAIVSDEANTGGIFLAGPTAGAPPHDWLCLTGGAIGQGMPVATGASVACPGRKVLSLEADGSAMYTLQSLWTQAREGLDVTTVIYNNGSYAVLEMELGRVGAEAPGPRARSMLELSKPDLDFVALAKGMGVPARRASTCEDFSEHLGRALAEPGPSLVEVMVGRGLG